MSEENRNLRSPNEGIDDFFSEEQSRQGRAERRVDSPPPLPPPPAQAAPARNLNVQLPADEIEALREAAQQRHGRANESNANREATVLSAPPPPPHGAVSAAPDLNLRPPLDDDPDVLLETATAHAAHTDQPGRTMRWDDPLPTAAPAVIPIEPPSRAPQILAAAFLIAAVAAGGYFVFRNRDTTTPASAPAVASAPAPTEATSPLGADVPAIDLPPLEESDEVVRQLVKELSSHPSVAAWLATDNLIRNFTVVVTNIAAGEPATTRVTALRPRTGFQVNERGEDLFIDSRSYSRYLPLATATTSINPDGAAGLYTMLKPRIDDAYAELGLPDRTFDQTLERAIVLLLRTPVPQGQVAVEPNGPVIYRFADPALERLTPSQKLLIRFGPDNQRAVQTSLRNVALALGIPPERLP